MTGQPTNDTCRCPAQPIACDGIPLANPSSVTVCFGGHTCQVPPDQIAEGIDGVTQQAQAAEKPL